MNSPVVFQNKKGFTLVEVLVVIGLVGIVFAFGSLVNVKLYTREISASEVSTLVAVLQKARSRAMNNIGAEPHGVYLGDADEYILFSGNSHGSGDEEDRVKKEATVSGITEIVFEQLSGNTEDVGTITLTENSIIKNVSINELGLISW